MVYGTPVWEAAVDALLLMLAPEVPHIAEELWQYRHGQSQREAAAGFKVAHSIHVQPWPVFDAALASADVITLVIQVNGKLRDKIEVPADVSEATAQELALTRPAVQKWIEGKQIRKVIFAGGRLVNIVVG